MQESVILTGRVSRRKDFRKDFRVGCWQQGGAGQALCRGWSDCTRIQKLEGGPGGDTGQG